MGDCLKANLFGSVLVLFSFGMALSACAKSDGRSASTVQAQVVSPTSPVATVEQGLDTADDSALDELDPFDPNINQKLKEMDRAYEEETGVSAHISTLNFFSSGCRRETCRVYARVEKSEQRMYLYVNGNLQGVFATSTGIPGRGTPDFDTHPDGRVYDRYTSTKFPGGDFNGLGNMPYAVFIGGGFAIHGTGVSNWKKLGHVASHGCIRIHPDNALIFNRLVRENGAMNTWITVE